jgi:hypothetical protein
MEFGMPDLGFLEGVGQDENARIRNLITPKRTNNNHQGSSADASCWQQFEQETTCNLIEKISARKYTRQKYDSSIFSTLISQHNRFNALTADALASCRLFDVDSNKLQL